MFKHRSNQKEILDLGPGHYTPQEFTHCQKMLYLVNQLLGCFHGTVKQLKQCHPKSHVLDVGCGAGLFTLNLGRYFPGMTFHGIDISAEAIEMAKKEKASFPSDTSNITFQHTPQPSLTLSDHRVDVILANMVCHHMTDQEMVDFLQQAQRIAKHQIIINDLHRHVIAYWFYRVFSPIIFRNRLITHDGLISIKRSFRRRDLIKLIKQAGAQHYQIKWCFPFRWRVTIWNRTSLNK